MNVKIIKNAEVFSPERLGAKDIVIANDKIIAIEENINISGLDAEIIDAKGMIVTPGFVDQHVHLTGGGGEGGFKTRVPEVMLSDLTTVGTTTVIGLMGTDGTTREVVNLFAKSKGLTEEGITAYFYTGSYQIPTKTVTGSVREDIVLLDNCLGAKMAMSDHRSSFPTLEEIAKTMSDIRVAGMIAGKKGILHIHLGAKKNAFGPIKEFLEAFPEFPITHFLPSHCGRSKDLFEQYSLEFARKGGYIDLTTGGSYDSAESFKTGLEADINPAQMSFSTDGNGSMPKFDAHGNMTGLTAASVGGNLEAFKRTVELGVNLETALLPVTKSPAFMNGLTHKGILGVGLEADICIFDSNLELQSVMAKGKMLVQNKDVLVKGTFEK